MQDAAQEDLPPSMSTEWTELALLQLQTGNTAMYVFILAVVLVFLVLAAQYESWSLPLAVILVVPMCLLCSIAGVLGRARRTSTSSRRSASSCWWAWLARTRSLLWSLRSRGARRGPTPRQATLDAVQLRLRPIMMTSFAFILGVVPLVIAEGAGAEMRRTLGTAVFSGMLGVTLFGIFLTPVFYYVIQWFTDTILAGRGAGERRGTAAGHGPHHEDRPDHLLPLDPNAGRQEHDGGVRPGP